MGRHSTHSTPLTSSELALFVCIGRTCHDTLYTFTSPSCISIPNRVRWSAANNEGECTSITTVILTEAAGVVSLPVVVF